jgi:hypothetical protein
MLQAAMITMLMMMMMMVVVDYFYGKLFCSDFIDGPRRTCRWAILLTMLFLVAGCLCFGLVWILNLFCFVFFFYF